MKYTGYSTQNSVFITNLFFCKIRNSFTVSVPLNDTVVVFISYIEISVSRMLCSFNECFWLASYLVSTLSSGFPPSLARYCLVYSYYNFIIIRYNCNKRRLNKFRFHRIHPMFFQRYFYLSDQKFSPFYTIVSEDSQHGIGFCHSSSK